MVSRVIGPLLGFTVKRVGSPMAVAGTAVIENTVSITNATPINNRRNEDAWPDDRAARHEITPAERRIECLANKEIIFTAAICEIVLIPDTCPEPMSDSLDSQITCIPDNCRLTLHSTFSSIRRSDVMLLDINKFKTAQTHPGPRDCPSVSVVLPRKGIVIPLPRPVSALQRVSSAGLP